MSKKLNMLVQWILETKTQMHWHSKVCRPHKCFKSRNQVMERDLMSVKKSKPYKENVMFNTLSPLMPFSNQSCMSEIARNGPSEYEMIGVVGSVTASMLKKEWTVLFLVLIPSLTWLMMVQTTKSHLFPCMEPLFPTCLKQKAFPI